MIPVKPVVITLVCLFHFAREAAGAAGTRLSLRPLIRGAMFVQSSGASRRENVNACLDAV
jgi:hypothetical protein